MEEAQRNRDLQKWSESIDSELYEELLNRYERVLVYAGQLQEKMSQQKLLVDQNQDLESENHRLKRSLDLSESYIRLLEGALGALGVMDTPSGSETPE